MEGPVVAEIKTLYRTRFPKYREQIDDADPVRQPRYYRFNIWGINVWSRQKAEEKLDDLHWNPVRAGLVERAVDLSLEFGRLVP